jgi:hypothetical protein
MLLIFILYVNQSNITQGDTQVDTWISRYVIWDIWFTKNFKFGF